MTISFDVSRVENDLIMEVVKRGEGLDAKFDAKRDRMGSVMDVTAAHANGCPMDLVRWLAADDVNFAHDWYGIRRHLDRSTGQLGDFFLPRFAYPEAKRVA